MRFRYCHNRTSGHTSSLHQQVAPDMAGQSLRGRLRSVHRSSPIWQCPTVITIKRPYIPVKTAGATLLAALVIAGTSAACGSDEPESSPQPTPTTSATTADPTPDSTTTEPPPAPTDVAPRSTTTPTIPADRPLEDEASSADELAAITLASIIDEFGPERRVLRLTHFP